MTETAITQLNIKWGICGFASSLAAMYSHGNISGVVDDAVSKGHLNTRLLAEIKTYLNILKSENKIILLQEIRDFTRSFKGYGNFTIDNFILKINSVAVDPVRNITKDFSIAMPPNAVLDYLKRVGGFVHAREISPTAKQNNVILGLSSGKKSKPYKGLGHWVYKKTDNEIYNWGKQVALKDILKDFKIVYQIAL